MATGVLPVCFGEATKYARFGLDADKAYVARARLGVTTETGDAEGAVVAEKSVPTLTSDSLKQVFAQFTGEIIQVPSMYSALKHKGRPLYEYARKGIVVDRPGRPVKIYQLDLIELSGRDLVFFVRCSKGTYIRTLAEDIGNQIGCGAHLIGLRRTGVANFGLDSCHTLESLRDFSQKARTREIADYTELDRLLLPVDQLVNYLPEYRLNSANTRSLLHGQKVRISGLTVPKGLCRLYSDDSNRFLGIGETDKSDPELLSPVRLISTVTN